MGRVPTPGTRPGLEAEDGLDCGLGQGQEEDQEDREEEGEEEEDEDEEEEEEEEGRRRPALPSRSPSSLAVSLALQPCRLARPPALPSRSPPSLAVSAVSAVSLVLPA